MLRVRVGYLPRRTAQRCGSGVMAEPLRHRQTRRQQICSALYGAFVVKRPIFILSLCQPSLQFNCSAPAEPFSRPGRSFRAAGARGGGQRMARLRATAKRREASLTAASKRLEPSVIDNLTSAFALT
jgi:hypothetical protein